MSAPTLDTPFPICPVSATLWDGETYYEDEEGGRHPSASSDEFIPVFGPGTSNPIGITIEEYCKWFKRIKEWDITFSKSGSASGGGGGVSASIELSNEEKTSGEISGESETALACVTPFWSSFSIQSVSDSPPPTSTGAASASGAINITIALSGASLYNPSDGKIYPLISISVSGSLQADGAFSPEEGEGGVAASSTTFKIDDGDGTAKILDMEISISGKTFMVSITGETESFSSGVGASATTGIVSLGLSLTPKTCWEWGPGDGDGPIVNSSTGAILRQL